MGDTETGVPAPGTMPGSSGDEEPIPFMQQVLDNPFLLLFLGVAIPTVFYIIWGVMEVIAIPMTN